jgi:hypothetical protein
METGGRGDDEPDSLVGLPEWLCARRRHAPAFDVQRTLRALDSDIRCYLATHIDDRVLSLLGYELGLYVERYNSMSALDEIRKARGAIQRVNDDVAKTVAEVVQLEQEAKDLAKAAVAKPLQEISAVKAELNGMINELAQITNGAPDGPLPGSGNHSTALDGGFVENPTNPQP